MATKKTAKTTEADTSTATTEAEALAAAETAVAAAEAKTASYKYVSMNMTDKVLTVIDSVADASSSSVVIAIPSSMQFPEAKRLVANMALKLYKAYRG
jgi:transcription antitermination factor NusG